MTALRSLVLPFIGLAAVLVGIATDSRSLVLVAMGWAARGGIESLASLVASLPRSRSRRGGTLRLDSPGARAVFKQRGEASTDAGTTRRWHPFYGWSLPVVTDPSVPRGRLEIRIDETRLCNRSRGTHYHGAGDRCQCGETANVYAELRDADVRKAVIDE